MKISAKVIAVLGTTFLMGSAFAAGTATGTGTPGTGNTGAVSTGTGDRGDTSTGTDAAGATSIGGTNDTGPSSATGSTADSSTGAVGSQAITTAPTRGTTSVAAAGNSTQTRDVQSALSGKGYDLQVDGVMGKNTRNALMRFQKDEGLTESGQLDEETLRALNIQSDRVPSSVPAMPVDGSEAPVAPDTDL